MWNKLVRACLDINKKLLKIVTIVSGVITLIYIGPKLIESLNNTYKQLDNKFVKNIVSFVIDINTLTKGIECIQYIGIGLFIVCIIILAIRFKYKNKNTIEKIIICHSSMSNIQFKADIKNKYNVKDINLISDMEGIKNDYSKIKYAIKKQDNFVQEFKRNINLKYEYGYMGIAHTPLILRIGNQIGDEMGIVLFHKHRTGNTKVFKELSNDMQFKNISTLSIKINENSNELIVGVSTTFEIKYEELGILKPNDKNVIIFELNKKELGFDVVTSERQVEDYVQFIMRKVRNIVKDNNITKIHMVLSTSVAMTFALGQAISNNNDPDIIIYNYDINNTRKYTWGIDLFKDYEDCVVDTGSEKYK